MIILKSIVALVSLIFFAGCVQGAIELFKIASRP